MDIKTTRKAHVYIVMKREGKEWVRVAGSYFDKRSDARSCVLDLNNTAKSKRRYRVGKMAISSNRTAGGF